MTYKIGSSGEMVRRIQEALVAAGFAMIADGIFGTKTDKAVRAFQQMTKLTPDGIVGPKTLAALGISDNTTSQTVAIEQTDHTTLRLKRSTRRINEIIIHCTATPEGRDYTIEQIRRDHKARGFTDVGYHYVVYRDGTIHEGRDVNKIGAHCKYHNDNSIGISYIGGVTNIPGLKYEQQKTKDTRTLKQKDALLNLLEALRIMYPKARIIGHRDTSPDLNGDGIIEPNEWIKTCPSFDAKKEYKSI